ncbi:MAG: YihY family inner membrane protein [Proteobacteria bacterium]|nr:YihY family inner membrane protein [Pseudomonadota bacterium]
MLNEPSLAAIFTLLGLFLPILGSHSALLDQARHFLFKNLATGSGSQVIDYLESFIAGLNLKKIGMSAFVGLLVTLVLLLRQIEEALNRIWLVNEARAMLTRFIYFWLFLTLGMFGLSVLIGLSASFSVTALITQKTLAAADRADSIPLISLLFSWLAGCVLFFLIYKIVPNCDVRTKSAARGALLAGTLFYVLGKFYTIYVASYASYKSVYGTLAALPIFLLWLYVCWVILLAGALFAWRTQTGFPTLDQEATVEGAKTHLDQLRNHAIQSRLPLAILLIIHAKFADGSGNGVSTSELVDILKLPHAWVHDASDLLRDLKLILNGRLPAVAGSVTTAGERWFPTNPAELVSVDHFEGALKSPIDDWATGWNPSISPAIKQLIISREGLKPNLRVSDLISKV